MAINNATTHTPDPTIRQKSAPICYHFQRGICNYGESCWKRLKKLPLYIEPWGPKIDDSTTDEPESPELTLFSCEQCGTMFHDIRILNAHRVMLH